MPSWVLVPLPSSSRITSDLEVADLIISEASWIQRRARVTVRGMGTRLREASVYAAVT